jgi:hypothetical protein
MKVFLSHIGGNVLIQMRAEGEDFEGDATRLLGPSDDFFGYSFAEMLKLGEGEHDITEKETAP